MFATPPSTREIPLFRRSASIFAFNVFDRVQLQAGTYTTPDGRLRYSISGSTIAFRQGRRPDTNENAFKARKYAVRGQSHG